MWDSTSWGFNEINSIKVVNIQASAFKWQERIQLTRRQMLSFIPLITLVDHQSNFTNIILTRFSVLIFTSINHTCWTYPWSGDICLSTVRACSTSPLSTDRSALAIVTLIKNIKFYKCKVAILQAFDNACLRLCWPKIQDSGYL